MAYRGYTQAQNKATQKYQKKAYDSTLIRFKKGYIEETLKPAAENAGESVNAFIVKAIQDRVDVLLEKSNESDTPSRAGDAPMRLF